jgi:thiol-disulfide isomerase/thioredoxin
MKYLFIIILSIVSMSTIAQNHPYTTTTDTVTGSLIFDGPITFTDLNHEPSFTWLKSGYDEYTPDKTQLNYLRDNLSKYRLVVFMGTWCDDSHYLIPKLEKVLQLINYPMQQYTMYGADREKKTIGNEHEKYGITLVPTVILFDGEHEVGRITETVNNSIEADLADIISKYQQH